MVGLLTNIKMCYKETAIKISLFISATIVWQPRWAYTCISLSFVWKNQVCKEQKWYKAITSTETQSNIKIDLCTAESLNWCNIAWVETIDKAIACEFSYRQFVLTRLIVHLWLIL